MKNITQASTTAHTHSFLIASMVLTVLAALPVHWESVAAQDCMLGIVNDLVAFNSADTLYIGTEPFIYHADREYSPEREWGYVGGFEYPWNHRTYIGGDQDLDLYKCLRIGLEGYQFDVPNGTYVVKLGFAETEHDWRGQRVQDVLIEDLLVLGNLDIWDLVEHNYAFEHRSFVTVEDGQLNVALSPVIGETMLANIVVTIRSPDSEPPPEVGWIRATGGYDMNIVHWEELNTTDLAGYMLYRKDGWSLPYEPITENPVSLRRHLDRNVNSGQEYKYRVTAVDLFGNESGSSPAATAIPVSQGDSVLPWFMYIISEGALEYLNTHVFENEYVDVILCMDVYTTEAELRYKGATSRTCPKKSHKFRFDAYDPILECAVLNCNSDRGDPSLIREQQAYRLFREVDILTPVTSPVLLWCNEDFRGVYTRVEQVDTIFAAARDLVPGGSIFECEGTLERCKIRAEYDRRYDLKMGNRDAVVEIIRLTEFLSSMTRSGIFEDLAEDLFDIDEALTWYALQVLLGNSDFIGHNYMLYHDTDVDRWRTIPWDLDRTFGRPMDNATMPLTVGTEENPVEGRFNRLWDRLLGIPRFRRRFGLILEHSMATCFNTDSLAPHIEAAHDLVLDDGRRDYLKHFFEDNTRFEESSELILDFVGDRVAWVYTHVDSITPPSSVNLYLNEILVDNQTIRSDEAGDYDPWIEIFNFSGETVSFDGLILSDGAVEWPFPEGCAVEPGGYLLTWLDGEPEEGILHATFRPDTTASAILLLDPGNTFENPVDSLYYGMPEPDVSYCRYRDGGYFSVPAETPTPLAPNNWESPVTLNVSCEPDTISPGEQVTLTFTVWNISERQQQGAARYHVRLSDGIRWPYTGEMSSFPFSMGPGEYEEFTRECYVKPSTEDGTYIIEASAVREDGAVYCEVRDSLEILFARPCGLCINEFLASNEACFPDEYGEYDDWFELYNSGNRTLVLRDVYATDDLGVPDKFKLPELSLPPGGFALLWADADTSQGALHCSFKLDRDGEEIGLFAERGGKLKKVDFVVFGYQETDISSGRFPDGGEVWVPFTDPTPGGPNE